MSVNVFCGQSNPFKVYAFRRNIKQTLVAKGWFPPLKHIKKREFDIGKTSRGKASAKGFSRFFFALFAPFRGCHLFSWLWSDAH